MAKVYHRALSIHPFANGNGRIFRLMVESILERLHINPPLFWVWGEDLLLREDSFILLFKDSVHLSDLMHANFQHTSGDQSQDQIYLQKLRELDITPLLNKYRGKAKKIKGPLSLIDLRRMVLANPALGLTVGALEKEELKYFNESDLQETATFYVKQIIDELNAKK